MPNNELASLLIQVPTSELARRTGFPDYTISRWRMGNCLPLSRQIPVIAEGLGIPPEIVAQAIASDKAARKAARVARILEQHNGPTARADARKG